MTPPQLMIILFENDLPWVLISLEQFCQEARTEGRASALAPGSGQRTTWDPLPSDPSW